LHAAQISFPSPTRQRGGPPADLGPENDREAEVDGRCHHCSGNHGPTWSPSLTLRARNTFAARRWGLTGEVSAGLVLLRAMTGLYSEPKKRWGGPPNRDLRRRLSYPSVAAPHHDLAVHTASCRGNISGLLHADPFWLWYQRPEALAANTLHSQRGRCWGAVSSKRHFNKTFQNAWAHHDLVMVLSWWPGGH
jgi:hypothetical protein